MRSRRPAMLTALVLVGIGVATVGGIADAALRSGGTSAQIVHLSCRWNGQHVMASGAS